MDGYMSIVVSYALETDAQEIVNFAIEIDINLAAEFLFKQFLCFFGFRKIYKIIDIQAQINGWLAFQHGAIEETWRSWYSLHSYGGK